MPHAVVQVPGSDSAMWNWKSVNVYVLSVCPGHFSAIGSCVQVRGVPYRCVPCVLMYMLARL